jgi:hypothetical protein
MGGARSSHFRSQVPAMVVCQAIIVSPRCRLGVKEAEMKRNSQKKRIK